MARPKRDPADIQLSPKEYVAKYPVQLPPPAPVPACAQAASAKAKAKEDPNKVPVGLVAKEDAIRVISRRMTSMALFTLGNICEHSKNDSARVSAAKEILDRAWGKSHIMSEGETKPGTQIQVVFGEKPRISVIENTATIEPDDDDLEDQD